MGRAIDAHIHCSDKRRDDRLRPYAKLNGLKYDLQELLSQMEENGVDRGLLLSPPVGDGEPLPNTEVLALCGRSRDRLFPVFTVEPRKRAVREALTLSSRNRDVLRGFKVRLGYREVFATDPVFAPLYDHAEENKLPVLFHTGDTATSTGSLVHAHPMTIDALANEREELRIVVCHMGNPWILDTAELLYKHPNVHADISGLVVGGGSYTKEYSRMLSQRLTEAVYYAGGAGKLLFGTDYPVETYGNGLALVGGMSVSQSDKEKILWRNAERLYRL